MKHRKWTIALVAAAAACGELPRNQNSGTNNANKGGRPAATAIASPTPIKGEKVTVSEDVRFTAEQDSPNWKWTDPSASGTTIEVERSEDTLKFVVPTGRDLYGTNGSAPRFIKPVEGDFQIEVRIKFDPREDYQGAGILVQTGPDRYLRFERGFGGVEGGTSGLRLDVRTGSDYKAITTPDDVPTEATSVDLKLLRIANSFTAFWRVNEDSEWKEVGLYESEYPQAVEVGLIACNTGVPIRVEFSNLKLAPVP